MKKTKPKKKPTSALTKHLPTKLKPKKDLSLPIQIPSHAHAQCQKPQAKNTPAYYHCLANSCQGKNITKACADCKKKAQAWGVARQKEITVIQNSWKQIGLSLTRLIPN